MPSKPRKEPKKPSTPKAAAQEDRMRRVREESRQRHHDGEVLQQQSRAALDKEPLTPVQAAKQLRAFAEMLPGSRANQGEEIAGSILVKMARLGAFAAYPEAQSLLTAHAAKSPTVSRIGAWMDTTVAIRRQRGLPCENLFETFSEDAAFAASLIETDPVLAKLPGACPVRTGDAAAVIKAADAVFEAWGAMCVYANRNAQYTDIGAKAAGKEELLRRFSRREEAARHAEQRIDVAIAAISTVDADLESVTGEKPRAVLAKAKPALMELKSIVGLASPLDKRYASAMETVATAQRVARGLDFAPPEDMHKTIRTSAILERGYFQEVPVNDTACSVMARCFEELLALNRQATLAAPDSEQYCERDWENLDQKGTVLYSEIAGLAPRVAGELASVSPRAGLVSENAVRFAQSLREGEWCLSNGEYEELVRLLRTGAAITEVVQGSDGNAVMSREPFGGMPSGRRTKSRATTDVKSEQTADRAPPTQEEAHLRQDQTPLSSAGSGELKDSNPEQPILNTAEICVVQALKELGRRVSGDVLQKKAFGKANAHGKGILSGLVRRKVITNKRDVKPPGYGLPEWP